MCWPWHTLERLLDAAMWAAAIGGGIWLFRRFVAVRRQPDPTAPLRRSLAILNERYARGEIDRDEYLERRAYLEG